MAKKAEIQANIDSIKSSQSALEADIMILRQLKNQLESYVSKAQYVLTNHETIKEIYHLAGTPYLNMTTGEEDYLDTVSTLLDFKTAAVVTAVQAKISELELSIGNLRSQIVILTLAQSLAKE